MVQLTHKGGCTSQNKEIRKISQNNETNTQYTSDSSNSN